MHRFFIDPNSIHNGQFKSTDKELCHQVSKVLKMRVGKQIILCDNSETEHLAEWTLVSRSDCQAEILSSEAKADISSERAVHLFVPPLKNQSRWELILEKGTEIGVASFTPLITKRTEVTELRKLDRLQRIVKEAAEQSGRTILPIIEAPVQMADLISASDFRPPTVTLIATLSETSQTIPNILKPLSPRPSTINLFIGPVGDFTEEEVAKSIEHNFYSISLGSQVLRTETAALAAAVQLLCSPSS